MPGRLRPVLRCLLNGVSSLINIEVIQVGALATNCYVLSDRNTNECVIIDPGGDADHIQSYLETRDVNPIFILATHAHADHIGAVKTLVERYGSQFMIGTGDAQSVDRQPDWLTTMLGDFQDPPQPDKKLNHGDKLDVGQISIEVLSTPGHTPGSSSFRIDDHVLTGDTLFRESIGRFDLPGGNEAQEISSIKNILFALDDETLVFPGHGPSSSIGHEKMANRFIH